MKKLTIAAALAAVALAVTVPSTIAQTGGYDTGAGMMGGYGGYGHGPGMMGGYGGYGMGPGIMGGYGGYGMGPGMMGGYGRYGMGPGMMYGDRAGTGLPLNLTDDQREKITKVQQALWRKHWELMGKLQEQRFRFRELVGSGKADDAAVGKAYKEIEGLRQQLWTSGADAQKQIDAVLTKEQREQLQRGWGRGGY